MRNRVLAIVGWLALQGVVGVPIAYAQDLEPPRLNVHAEPGVEPAAARVAQLDRAALLRVMQLVGTREPPAPITVVLAAEDSALARSAPYWIAGFANGASSSIVLFPSRSPSYPHDSLADVLLHEVAHVLITRAARGADVPRWFHEGLALAAERGTSLRDRTTLMMAVALERRAVDELDAAFSAEQGEASRAYALSGALVRDLLRRHGPDTAAHILSGMAAGQSFELAVQRVTGQTMAAVEERFWRDNWWQQVVPFLTSSVVLWFGVVLLAVYARRARAVRRARLRRQWAEEEAHEQALELEQG